MNAAPRFKAEPVADRKHLKRVSNMRCLCCGALPPNVAHHLRMSREGGVGLKPGDDLTVSLCDFCHKRLHSMPEVKFWVSVVLNDPAEWGGVLAKHPECVRELVCDHARSQYPRGYAESLKP